MVGDSTRATEPEDAQARRGWLVPPLPDQPELVRPVRLAAAAAWAALGVCLLATFNAFVLAPLLATTALPGSWRFLPLGFAVLYLLSISLLRRRLYFVGRIVLMATGCLQVVSFARLIGLEPGTPYLVLVPLVAAPLLFARRESLGLWIALGMSLATLAGVHLVGAGKPPLVPVDAAFVPWVRVAVLALGGSLAVAALVWNNHLVTTAQEALAREKRHSDELLLNILPQPVAERLKRGVNPLADGFDQVTVLFADIVGFTSYAAEQDPEDVVVFLNEVFSGFDALAERHGVEKIKTIGDAYMIGSGLPKPRSDHAEAAAEMALGMMEHVKALNERSGVNLEVRIGIHSGRVVAGVIGHKKFAYDLWGDTVNVASRLEDTGAASRIHVSEDSHRLLAELYDFEPRGATELKGRGAIPTYFLLHRREAA